MSETKPRWNRRKDERPAEIIEAATVIFIEKGFAAAKLDDVARRAGIAKGTLYRYFDNKEEMFRAVVRQAMALTLVSIEKDSSTSQGSTAELPQALLTGMAQRMGSSRMPAILRLVIAESLTFPDLARIWHDDVVSTVLAHITDVVRRGQAQGQVRDGDPRLYAFSITGPLITALLYREVLGQFDEAPLDLAALAAHHGRTVVAGLIIKPANKG